MTSQSIEEKHTLFNNSPQVASLNPPTNFFFLCFQTLLFNLPTFEKQKKNNSFSEKVKIFDELVNFSKTLLFPI